MRRGRYRANKYNLMNHQDIQTVILAGGLGTRLADLAKDIPKSLVAICGRPFLHYQLEWLASHGLTDILLCIGYLGEQIEAFAGDGSAFGVKIRYSCEQKKLLGTAGAIKNAEPLLAESFCVLNGDSYLPINPWPVIERFFQNDLAGLMTVYRNHDLYDKSNVIVEGDFVKLYDREKKILGLDAIDYGLQIFKKEALRLIPANKFVNMDFFYQALIRQCQLASYDVQEPFYEVGSAEGVARFNQYVEQGRLCKL